MSHSRFYKRFLKTIAQHENENCTAQIASITNPNFQPIMAQPVQFVSQPVQPGMQEAVQQLYVPNAHTNVVYQAPANPVPAMEPPPYEDVKNQENSNLQ